MFYFSSKSTFFTFISSNVTLLLVGIVSGFFTFGFVSPDLLGIYGAFAVFEVYASFGRLGVINGLSQQLPLLYGKGNKVLALEYAATALSFNLSGGLITISILVFYLLKQFPLIFSDINYQLSFATCVLRITLTQYTSYLSVTFRTNNDFKKLAKVNVILAVVKLSSIPIIQAFGFNGLLIRESLLIIVEVLALHLFKSIDVKPRLDINRFRELFHIGVFIFTSSSIRSFAETIPRLFLVYYATTKTLGLFSPIMVILNVAAAFPQAVNSYLYPKMLSEFGKEHDKRQLWKYATMNYKVSFLLSVPLAIGTFVIATPFSKIFPFYSESSDYIELVSIALLFSANKVGYNIINILGSKNLIISTAILNILLYVVALLTLQVFYKDKLLIAVGSIIMTNLVLFIYIYFTARRLVQL